MIQFNITALATNERAETAVISSVTASYAQAMHMLRRVVGIWRPMDDTELNTIVMDMLEDAAEGRPRAMENAFTGMEIRVRRLEEAV